MAYGNRERSDKSRGAMFPNNRKQGSQPDFWGNIELSLEDIKNIVALEKAGEQYSIRIAGWKEKSRNGTNYISCSLRVETDQERQRNSGGRGRGGRSSEWDDGGRQGGGQRGGGNDWNAPADNSGVLDDLDDEIPF